MNIKKVIFAPLFLGLTATLYYLFKLVLDKHLEVFLGEWGGMQELGLIALVIIFLSLTYCLYITFTQSVKYFAPLAISGSLTPFIFLKPEFALIASVGFLISFSIVYFNLQTSLKTYINFQPVNLLSTPVKTLNTLLVLSLAICFYFQSNTIIQKEGFKIPEPVIDWAIDLSMKGASIPVKGEKYLAQIPALNQEQINSLKQNPEILKQYGLDPKDLDELTPTVNSSSNINQSQNALNITPKLPGGNLKDMLKAQITDSLDQIVKPYLFAIPIVLAFLFYSIAGFALWILSFFLSLTILLIFFILEKTGFIRFDKEMREVKKMVV